MNTKCKICFTAYSDVNVPKTFPCGHSICDKCLKALLIKGVGYSCVICRKIYTDASQAITSYDLIGHKRTVYDQDSFDKALQINNQIDCFSEELKKLKQRKETATKAKEKMLADAAKYFSEITNQLNFQFEAFKGELDRILQEEIKAITNCQRKLEEMIEIRKVNLKFMKRSFGSEIPLDKKQEFYRLDSVMPEKESLIYRQTWINFKTEEPLLIERVAGCFWRIEEYSLNINENLDILKATPYKKFKPAAEDQNIHKKELKWLGNCFIYTDTDAH